MNNTTNFLSQVTLQSDLLKQIFLSLFSIIGGAIIGGAITRHYDSKITSESKLYYPLYFSCYGILNVLNDPMRLKDDYSLNLLKSYSKTLDEIIYVYGSIIYLKEAEYINKIFEVKSLLDREIILLEKRNWEFIEERIEGKEIKKIKNNSNELLQYCKNNVKLLDNISM